MTLKAFADASGINYNLAKQWRNRGKIVTEGDGYRLATSAPVTVGAVTQLTVAEPTVTGLPVTAKPIKRAVTEPEGSATVESCAGCVVQSARLESCEYAIESLRSDVSGLRDHVAALEILIADLKAANRDMVAGQLRYGQTVRRNGRAEIVDGDYLDSQRWEQEGPPG